MIYITGDCHGNFERFNPSIFPEQSEIVDTDNPLLLAEFSMTRSVSLRFRWRVATI